MSANVGTIDRLVRVLLGLILLALPFISGWGAFNTTWISAVSVILGIVMLVTAGMRVCPIYRVFGIRTCRM